MLGVYPSFDCWFHNYFFYLLSTLYILLSKGELIKSSCLTMGVSN